MQERENMNQNEESDTLSEEELFQEYINTGAVDARNKLVDKYLYLAEIISKKFINRGVEYEDIYQVASIGLIRAVERFDLSKGVKFVSFATPTVIGEVKRFFRDKASTIRVPRRIYEVYQKVNFAKENLTQQFGRAPKVEEIASYLGMSEEMILEIIESSNVHNIQSFDQQVYTDDDIELHETIGSEDNTFERIENRDYLKKSLDKFNDVEKEFIDMRYFKSKTQKQIAERMGVSQMYVSRLEKKVLDKFRKILSK